MGQARAVAVRVILIGASCVRYRFDPSVDRRRQSAQRLGNLRYLGVHSLLEQILIRLWIADATSRGGVPVESGTFTASSQPVCRFNVYTAVRNPSSRRDVEGSIRMPPSTFACDRRQPAVSLIRTGPLRQCGSLSVHSRTPPPTCRIDTKAIRSMHHACIRMSQSNWGIGAA